MKKLPVLCLRILTETGFEIDSLCRYLWPYGDDGGMSYNKKLL